MVKEEEEDGETAVTVSADGKMTCTDPGAVNDIPAWCRINGHKVLDSRETGEEVFITLLVS